MPSGKRIKYVQLSGKRTFGLELEVQKNINRQLLKNAIELVDLEHEVKITEWQKTPYNSYWHIKTDSTCGVDKEGGWEIIPFVGKGYKDLDIICKAVELIKKTGVKVNPNCGFHVHIGLQGFSFLSHLSVASNWLKIEKIINFMMPEHRVNNKFCVPIREQLGLSKFETIEIVSLYDKMHKTYSSINNQSRRVSLNFTNYISSSYDSKKTLELRIPEGTVEAEDVKNWTRFMVRFISIASKENIDYNSVLDIRPVSNLKEFFSIIGMSDLNDNFDILSSGYKSCKIWMLNRFIKYSKNQAIVKEAENIMNNIVFYRVINENASAAVEGSAKLSV